MALESKKISGAGLFIPTSLWWPGVYANQIHVWSQNPDPKILNPKKCLGTFYVARASDIIRAKGPVSGIEEKTLLIDKYLDEELRFPDKHDKYTLSAGGKLVLAECLDELSEMAPKATDIVVEIRSFSESRNDSGSAYKARVELHLSGIAYNLKR